MASKCAIATAALASLAAALPSPPTTQIVGGQDASLGQFPYLVSLSDANGHFCGGSLLNADTVLTAAHCTRGKQARNVQVRAGSVDRTTGGITSGVSELLMHPDYVHATTNNDVALWHLSSSIAESATISYSTIAAAGSDPIDGVQTTVSGWGYLRDGAFTLPVTAQYVEVPIVSRSECKAAYGASAITDAMICAAEEQGGEDACGGDSGGPLVVSATGVQVGIVSWGIGCAEAEYPGVYTNVGEFTEWIVNNAW